MGSVRRTDVLWTVLLTMALAGCRADDATGTVTVPADQPLPEPGTWVSDETELPKPLPPKLREAHKVAAEYLRLPLDEVYFAEVWHQPTGDEYDFVSKPSHYSCGVHVPSLAVWDGSVVPPWEPPDIGGLTFPLSYEGAARVAEAFAVERLGADMSELRLASDSDPQGQEQRRVATVRWTRYVDGVAVPGGPLVEIDVDTGEPVWFRSPEIPVKVGLKPSLSRQQAIERGLGYLFASVPRAEREEGARGTTTVEAYLMVGHFPRASPPSERPVGSRQRLVWRVVLETPLPEQWADWCPTRVDYCIDAHSGRLRDEAWRPMRPRVKEELQEPGQAGE